MKRRNFFFSLAGFPALLRNPTSTSSSANEDQPAALVNVPGEIVKLERFISEHPNSFFWSAHNELRHLYVSIDEAKSMWHANVILANSFMDDYILSVLSDWQLTEDSSRAAFALLNKTERHPTLIYLRAACLMQAGELCQRYGKVDDATKLYLGVLALHPVDPKLREDSRQYHRLAHFRLSGRFRRRVSLIAMT